MKALESVTKQELIEMMMDIRARDIITLIKILVSQVGKERTKELIKKARWGAWYQRGKRVAENAGNPQNLDSYIESYWVREMNQMPWVSPVEWDERTKNRAIATCTFYCIGKALAKLGDEVIKEIVREAYCVHDIAWASGFNSNIKIHLAKTYCQGDDCCQFVMEI